MAVDEADGESSNAQVDLYWTPTINGSYCVDAEHYVEDNDYELLYSQSSDCVSVSVPKINIIWNYNPITDTTQEAVIGQKINLSIAVTGNGTLTNPQWTIGGEKVKNYVVNYTDENSSTNAQVTELTTQDFSQGSIQFYWVDGGSYQIRLSAKINGRSYTATANFDVKEPTTQLTATTGTVGLGNIQISPTQSVFALHYGDYNSAGISFSANATLPNGVSGDIV